MWRVLLGFAPTKRPLARRTSAGRLVLYHKGAQPSYHAISMCVSWDPRYTSCGIRHFQPPSFFAAWLTLIFGLLHECMDSCLKPVGESLTKNLKLETNNVDKRRITNIGINPSDLWKLRSLGKQVPTFLRTKDCTEINPHPATHPPTHSPASCDMKFYVASQIH